MARLKNCCNSQKTGILTANASSNRCYFKYLAESSRLINDLSAALFDIPQ